MPIREYKCRRCGEVTEHIQGVDSAAPTECPKCGEVDEDGMERYIGQAPTMQRGPNWRGSKGNW